MAPDKQDRDLTDLPSETEKRLPWFIVLVYTQVMGCPASLFPTRPDLPHIHSRSRRGAGGRPLDSHTGLYVLVVVTMGNN